MFNHVIVPVDGSPASFRAIPIAEQLATAVGGTYEAVAVHRRSDSTTSTRAMDRAIHDLQPVAGGPCQIVSTDRSVSEVLSEMVSARPGSLVVMSSHGRGRSAAVLGGTTDAVLQSVGGPVLLVGPNCDVDRRGGFAGTYVVPLDGSTRAELMLPVVAAWMGWLGGQPWLVKAGSVTPCPISDGAYLSTVAHDLRLLTSGRVAYETLDGDQIASELIDFAAGAHATLVFMTTHGRTGLARLRAGSVTAEVVRRARCPVVVLRPADLGAERSSRRAPGCTRSLDRAVIETAPEPAEQAWIEPTTCIQQGAMVWPKDDPAGPLRQYGYRGLADH